MDTYTINLLLISFILLLPIFAQIKVNGNYNKYSKINNSLNLNGKEAAQNILKANGLDNVKICSVSGNLTDHYNPSNKTVYLSNGIYNNKSVASVAVAAHEIGHAMQDKERYSYLIFRSNMVPLVNFTSKISAIFIIIGFLFDKMFVNLGIILLLVGLLFQLITLPVEFNASARAKVLLKNSGLLSDTDIEGTNKVLNAAAFTYVAGFLATAMQILRIFLINNRRR